ncbi:hypothetical protein D9M69_576540 [compost metagenome]
MSQSRLTRSGFAQHGYLLALLNMQGEIGKCFNTGMRIHKIDMLKRDITCHRFCTSVFRADDIRLQLQKFINALLRSCCTLYHRTGPAQGRYREGEHCNIENELSNISHRNRTVNHFHTTHQDGDQQADTDEEAH